MVPAYGMVFLLPNSSTGNGKIPGCSFILSVGRAERAHDRVMRVGRSRLKIEVCAWVLVGGSSRLRLCMGGSMQLRPIQSSIRGSRP